LSFIKFFDDGNGGGIALMKKQSIVLGLVALVALVGCGKTTSSSSSNTVSTTATTSEGTSKSTSSNGSTSAGSTSSSSSSSTTPVDPEAAYKITKADFIKIFTEDFKNITVNQNKHEIAYDDEGKLEGEFSTTLQYLFAGALADVMEKNSDGSISSDNVYKFADGVTTHAHYDITATESTLSADDPDDNRGKNYDSVWDSYSANFMNNLLSTQIEDRDGFMSFLDDFFKAMTYDAATHSYTFENTADNGPAGEVTNACTLKFLNGKIQKLNVVSTVNGYYTVTTTSEFAFSDLGTTTYTVEDQEIDFLQFFIATFCLDDANHTVIATKPVGYQLSVDFGGFPDKAADSDQYAYQFVKWNGTATNIDSNVQLIGEWTKVEASTYLTFDAATGTATINSPSNVSSIMIPDTYSSSGTPIDVKAVAISSLSGINNIILGKNVVAIPDSNKNSSIKWGVKDGNLSFKTEDDALYSFDFKTLYSFYQYSKATSFTVNAATQTIKASAFYESPLTSVTLPNGLLAIENDAFSEMPKLTSIIIPDTVTSVGDNCFGNDEALKSATWSKACNAIPDSAFNACTSLSDFVIPTNVSTIGNASFVGTALTSVDIPSKVTSIGAETFKKCQKLLKVTLPNDDVLSAGGIFQECTALESIVIPANVTSIGDDCFSGCTSLKTVTFNDASALASLGSSCFNNCVALTDMPTFGIGLRLSGDGESCFAGCTSLKSLDFSRCPNITKIGAHFAEGDTALANISLPSTVTEIGTNAFSKTGLTSFHIGANMTFLGNPFTGCKKLATVTSDNANYQVANNLVTFQSSTRNDLVMAFGDYTSVVVPAGIKNLAQNSMAYANKAFALDLSAMTGTITFDDDIFYGSTLSSITWPTTVTSISCSTYTFQKITIDTLTIPNRFYPSSYTFFSNMNVKTLDLSATEVTTIKANYVKDNSTLQTIKLPKNLTTIEGNYALGNNPALESIVIPASVTTIKARTFSGDKNLKSVFFAATSKPATLETKWDSKVGDGEKESADEVRSYLYSETAPASNPTNYWHYVDGVPTVYAAA
jgi:major membrane immunogen (membrane-anchored lipoprotein)